MNTQQYLKEHTLNPKFLKETLGWAWSENKFTIPIYNKDGKKPFNKYRHLTGDAKFTYDKGNHPTLYPLWLAHSKKELVLCEGEPDAARLWQENIPAVTTVGGAGSLNEEMTKILSGKKIHLVLDNDKEGQKNIPKYIRLLKNANISVRIIDLPEQYKDVSEYFTDNYKKADFKSLPALTEDQWILNKFSTTYSIINNKVFLSKKHPVKKWLINPMMRATGIIFLIGEGGVGKTTISYSIAKAISEGTSWLDKYKVAKGRVLIIDKENEKIDIAESLFAQQATSKNIFHYTTPLAFNFVDSNGDPTDESLFVKSFVAENKISTIILDSMVDFYIGNENDSIDAAQNALAWKQTFPNCAIIPIHHENKPQQGIKNRSGIHRVRGSTHLFNVAQSVLSFSVPEPEYPERIMVEHTKVRGAKKQQPFLIEMVIESKPESTDLNETIITGFSYSGIIITQKKKREEVKEAIIELLANDPQRKFISKDIEIELSDKYPNPSRVREVLPVMRSEKIVACDVSNRPYSYWFLEESEDE